MLQERLVSELEARRKNSRTILFLQQVAQRWASAASGRAEKTLIKQGNLAARKMPRPCSSRQTGLPDLSPIQHQTHAIKRADSHLSTACRVRWHALTGPVFRSGKCRGARSKHSGQPDPARRRLKL